jgi:hypothetical protein
MNPSEYITWRNKIAQAWAIDPTPLTYIEPSEQNDLYDYFEFHRTKESEEALSHRATILTRRPELEERALEALDHLARELRAKQAPKATHNRKRGRRITVRSILRSEPDIQLYVRALIELAREEQAREAALKRNTSKRLGK